MRFIVLTGILLLLMYSVGAEIAGENIQIGDNFTCVGDYIVNVKPKNKAVLNEYNLNCCIKGGVDWKCDCSKCVPLIFRTKENVTNQYDFKFQFYTKALLPVIGNGTEAQQAEIENEINKVVFSVNNIDVGPYVPQEVDEPFVSPPTSENVMVFGFIIFILVFVIGMIWIFWKWVGKEDKTPTKVYESDKPKTQKEEEAIDYLRKYIR